MPRVYLTQEQREAAALERMRETLASDACILCNEEGRLLGMPYNTTIFGVSFVRPLLIAGIPGEDFAGLTEQQVDRLRSMGAIE